MKTRRGESSVTNELHDSLRMKRLVDRNTQVGSPSLTNSNFNFEPEFYSKYCQMYES